MDDRNGRAVSVIIAFHWAGTDRSADEELLWCIIAIFYGISASQCPSYFLFCSDGICYLLSEGSLQLETCIAFNDRERSFIFILL